MTVMKSRCFLELEDLSRDGTHGLVLGAVHVHDHAVGKAREFALAQLLLAQHAVAKTKVLKRSEGNRERIRSYLLSAILIGSLTNVYSSNLTLTLSVLARPASTLDMRSYNRWQSKAMTFEVAEVDAHPMHARPQHLGEGRHERRHGPRLGQQRQHLVPVQIVAATVQQINGGLRVRIDLTLSKVKRTCKIR